MSHGIVKCCSVSYLMSFYNGLGLRPVERLNLIKGVISVETDRTTQLFGLCMPALELGNRSNQLLFDLVST